MKDFSKLYTDIKPNTEILSEDYKKDTVKYIDDVLKNTDDKGAQKFLKGLQKFVDENGFLTGPQRKGLAQFHAGNPNK